MSKKGVTFNNYDYFIKTDTSSYKGEWIAIAGKAVENYQCPMLKYPFLVSKMAKYLISQARLTEKMVNTAR